MIIKASVVVTMDGPPIAHGAVLIDGNRIARVGHVAELAFAGQRPVIELPDHALLPGLINAHCHLDYTMMRNAISPPPSFTSWVERLNALKRSLDSDDYLAAIARGFAEANGADVWAESRPGQGATFVVALPAAPMETAE